MEKLKYIKIEHQDGTLSENVPIGVDANNVDVGNEDLSTKLNRLDANDTSHTNAISALNSSLQTSVTSLQSQVSSLASGSPAGVYATVAALTSADPDHSKIYVVTADGHWYYYNSGWQDGGAYFTSTVTSNDPIISKINGQIREITGNREIIMNIGCVKNTNAESGTVIDITDINTSQSAYRYAVVNCQENDVFCLNGKGTNSYRLYTWLDSNYVKISSSIANAEATNLYIQAPKNSAYIIINDTLGTGISYKNYGINNVIPNVENKIKSLERMNSSDLLINFFVGSRLNWQTGTIAEGYNDYITTDFILVEENFYYNIPIYTGESGVYTGYFCIYDNNYNYITGIRFSGTKTNDELNQLIINNEAKYFRYSFEKTHRNEFKISYVPKILNKINNIENNLIPAINEHMNEMDNTIKVPINKIIYSMGEGRGVLNNLGVIVATNYRYGWTSLFFYCLKGTSFSVPSTDYLLRVCNYTTADNGHSFSFVERVMNISSYVIPKDGWYRVTIENKDQSIDATTAIFDNLTGWGYLPYTSNFVTVYTFNDLVRAARNANIERIEIGADLAMGTALFTESSKYCVITNGNKVINGNGHTIIGNELIDHQIIVSKGVCYIKDLKCYRAHGTVIDVQNDATAYIENCNISYAGYQSETGGDGVGTHSNSKTYIKNCIIHDCLDEGVSTHDNAYCEVINTEAYHNGFLHDTETSSGLSFGGIHLGGAQMGKVINCYAHNNTSYGISFIPMFSPTDYEGIIGDAVCSENIVENNRSKGIVFSSMPKIHCYDNTIYNNGDHGIYFSVRTNYSFTTGNAGIVMNESILSHNTNNIGITSGGDSGLIFDKNYNDQSI